MFPAVFLDRDGVIIENVDTYVRSWSDVAVIPGAFQALARLSQSPYKIVLVTNQSAVGRGIISLETAGAINDRLVKWIEREGGRVDGVFMCPHAPPQGCACRKPKPGLIMQASSELDLDLSRSFLIGDALTDISAGKNAGIPTNILVQSGRGAAQLKLPEAQALAPFLVFDRLDEAVRCLLGDLLS